ncbi:MAG: signal recognition particle-docking protein FtsY [Firmicutes bacterium]|nr:signal recognition particle-docking protein FtsY [Bacillota bacterium]
MFKNIFKKNKKNEEQKNEEIQKVEETKDNNEENNKSGLLGKLKKGLEKTRKGITEKVDDILKSYTKIDEELFEDIEEVLITADVGVNTTMRIIDDVKDKVKEQKITEAKEIKSLLKEELVEILTEVEGNQDLNIEPSPSIMLVVGVNGVGKTTTIGKLASRLKNEGKKVLIAAGDTFRAAAIEQLNEWSNRAGVDLISHNEGADPAAVIFDGIQAAKARKADVLICDTAGRLHNKKNLMNELNKIFRIVGREYPEAKKEVMLVVDATTGQNAVIQAKLFKEACDITGIALTKLDGTAKGGVVLAVQSELKVPVKLVGVGEGLNDLQDFKPNDFVDALFPE